MLKFLQFFMIQDLLDVDGAAGGGGGGTPPVATPVATPAAAPATPPTDAVTWEQVRSALPEDIRDHPSFKPVTTIEAFAKNYIHAQSSIGKGKIVIPDEHATEEDRINVFKQLGTPEKIDDYNVNVEGEMNGDIFDSVKQIAFDSGIQAWQLEKIVNKYNEVAKISLETETTKFQQTQDDGLASLKKEWGEGFDSQVKKANIAFSELVPDEGERRALIEAGFGSNPTVLKLLANSAKFFDEDVFKGHGSPEFSGSTPEEALSKAREIQGNKEHPYRTPSHPNHEAAKKEVANLYKIAYPE
jgi:GH24 family phage-related lysozyme (muramidase)